MFFSKTSVKSCETLKSILKRYEEASGQCINVAKSGITFSSKTPLEVKERVKKILGISNEGGIGKYLGLPEHFGRRKKDIFTGIVDKVRQRTLTWTSRFLSGAGKQVLLKAVLAALPSYAMSCFKLPLSLCKRLQSAFTRYWWDDKPDKRKMSWVAWEKLTSLKSEGGLGFRDFATFNDSLLAKIGWNLLRKPESLLARVLLGKYCHASPFMEVQPLSNASHGWRGLLASRDILRKGLGWIVGNGEDIKVWNSPWLSTSSPTSPVGPPNKDSAQLLVKDLLCPLSHQWNLEEIRKVLPHHEDDILRLVLSSIRRPDKLRWLPVKSGDYSAKSGYAVARSDSVQGLEDIFNWQTNIWKVKTSPKVRMFLWKAARKALPVGTALQSRGIVTETECKRCGQQEDAVHIFLQCPFAAKLWDLAPVLYKPVAGSCSTMKILLSKARSSLSLPPVGLGVTPLYPWILWFLWKARNLFLFEGRQLSAEEVLQKAISEARLWQEAQLQQPPKQQPPITGKVKEVHGEAVLCFSDGAWQATSLVGGMGWIALTPQKTILLQGSTSRPFVSSALVAEALALKAGIIAALASGVLRLACFSDCQELISLLNSDGYANELDGILADISLFKSSFISISFHFVSRSENVLADGLAKAALLSCNFSSPSGV